MNDSKKWKKRLKHFGTKNKLLNNFIVIFPNSKDVAPSNSKELIPLYN